MSLEPVLATLRVSTSSGPISFDTSFALRQRRGRKVGHLQGSRDAVLLHASTRARRDNTMIAVVEASRGRYLLVPVRIPNSSGNVSISGLRDLVDVPGMQTLALVAEAAGLVAIVDHRQYVVSTGRRTVIARG